MREDYTFSREDGALVDSGIVAHLVVIWPFMVFIIYICAFDYNVFMDLFSYAFLVVPILACLMLLYSCVCLYNRWQLFKYDEETTLSIDLEQRSLIYKHNHKTLNYGLIDVDEWYWQEYKIDPYSTYMEIVEIKFKNGDKIIVSNGIGPVRNFFRYKWKELGIPEGEQSSRSLRSYMKEIESVSIK